MKVKTYSPFAIMLFSILALLMACETSLTETASNSDSDTDTAIGMTTDSNSPYKAHVAFAGGGWRAHSGHAGWTMALLDGHRTLDSAFAHIETLSSNSGGSWFNSMLTHSSKFVDSIQKKDAFKQWAKTGWLGMQEKLFNATDCHQHSGDLFSFCVGNYYASSFFHPLEGVYWDKVVGNLIYKDFPISGTLNGKHLDWAAEKSLLFAATMLTNEVVLNKESAFHLHHKGYYQVCPQNSKVKLKGEDGASCDPTWSSDVTPVTFSSLPRNSKLKPPPFLSALNSISGHDLFNIGYSQNAHDSPETKTITIANPLSDTSLSVQAAATASSAAVGFAASRAVTGSWDGSYEASDESLSFSLASGKVKYTGPLSDQLVKTLADEAIVRIADGGPADNSAVSQIVSFLQHNKQDHGFNIIAFDNVQQVFPLDCEYPQVGIDIANLFGQGVCKGEGNTNQFCMGDNCAGPCIDIPQLKIFEEESVKNPVVTWQAIKSPAYPMQILYYAKYAVKTVDNPHFGIKAGFTGTLHAFTCQWENAHTSPQNGGKWFYQNKTTDADFKAYDEMIQFINGSMKSRGLKPHLDAAFGLKH